MLNSLRLSIEAQGTDLLNRSILFELDDVGDGQAHAYALHVVVGAHVGEGPAQLLLVLDHLADGEKVILARGVLVAVGDNGHHHGMVGVARQFLLQLAQRPAHRIVERRAGAGDVGLLRQDGRIGHGRVPIDFVNGGAVEEDEREIVLLRVPVLLRGSLHPAQNFVVAHYRRLPDFPHRAAAVHDDHVVNLGLFNFLSHSASCFDC